MPWQKSFDEDNAVKSAMTLFWEKGYTDASMADLLRVTGLTKGSFYNAFGSKHDLFLKALATYDLENRRLVLQKFAALDSPRAALDAFFKAIILESAEDTDKKGCFLINTSLSLNMHSQEVQDLVTRGLGETETFFKQMIELGQARGDITKAITPAATAKAFMGALIGMRVLGRGVYDRAAMTTIATEIMRFLR